MLKDPQRLFFSRTASRPGRHLAVSPANSPLEYLHYGRIRLSARAAEPTQSRVGFESGSRETALLCMQGECRLLVTPAGPGEAQRLELGLHDAVYVPRGWFVDVSTDTEVDLVECSAEVTGDYPL